MRKLLIVALLGLGSVVQAQTMSEKEVTADLVAQRETQKKEITNSYLALSDNFITSDSVAAVNNAKALVNSFGKFKFKKLTLDQMNEATTTRKQIVELATEIAATKNINKQRKAFGVLSTKFWTIAAKLKPADMPLYQQVCPMTGDVWLSGSKEIKNPYFPKNMLTCGEVKASL
ncbi:DUF3347 domain-containing protein [Pedobacter xixiisoli]|uniref:DUF3347 domain-containing protein n=1 Tax=Pedobacter xixiisoli TaxID=1476464 RepID=A0A285ZXX5_9SPHI|nr:DUF3347 domain-containing protein [Pedobacter xixiisoli]SOD14499.1 Protein of unknown function [Pedobacter xixiisoli]